MKANDFTLGGTFGRDILFVGRTGGGAFTKGKEGTCMTLAVIVCLMDASTYHVMAVSESAERVSLR
jgi:hypothetical protein